MAEMGLLQGLEDNSGMYNKSDTCRGENNLSKAEREKEAVLKLDCVK